MFTNQINLEGSILVPSNCDAAVLDAGAVCGKGLRKPLELLHAEISTINLGREEEFASGGWGRF